MQSPFQPNNSTPTPVPDVPTYVNPGVGGQSLSLEAALYGALTSNPDLITLRQTNAAVASPESVEVARRFPTALNPTLWVDLRPITLLPRNQFAGSARGNGNGYYEWGNFYAYMSLRQPVELGHQTTHRYRIAKAAYDQQRWNVLQAELLALVQTYRFFQTAAYRRERYAVARDLAEFNDRLLKTVEQRLEANQVPPADVVLARVEARATRQLLKAAQQDYVTALTDLRNQVGIPETAGASEPLGEFYLPPFISPVKEDEFIQTAIQNRPDIHAAEALVRATKSAVDLSRADRIPTPIVGPQWASNESGDQLIGFVYITPIPIWNSGGPLVRQRMADHERAHLTLQAARQKAIAQVRSALARWNGAAELVKESAGLTPELTREVAKLERLFDQGQADLTILMQARQRLIQLRNSELDATWAATQAQADLLLALGTPTMIQGMIQQARADATPRAVGADSTASPPPDSTPSPFRNPFTTEPAPGASPPLPGR